MPQTNTSPNLLFDRNLVRLRRNRAAQGFGAFDFLLRQCLEDFQERLEVLSGERFQAGIGTGLAFGSHGLAEGDFFPEGASYAPQMLVLSDFSEGMAGASATAGKRPGSLAVVADEEWVPFGEAAFDLILAPLTLQFVNDMPGALIQLRRALKPGGLLLTALFGGETLTELRHALSQAEIEIEGGLSPRVIPFTDVKDFGALLQRVGFYEPVSDLDRLTVTYPSLQRLMHDLRGMGLANPMTERRKTPLSKATLARAEEIYRGEFGEGDELSASFHVLYGTAWAPQN